MELTSLRDASHSETKRAKFSLWRLLRPRLGRKKRRGPGKTKQGCEGIPQGIRHWRTVVTGLENGSPLEQNGASFNSRVLTKTTARLFHAARHLQVTSITQASEHRQDQMPWCVHLAQLGMRHVTNHRWSYKFPGSVCYEMFHWT